MLESGADLHHSQAFNGKVELSTGTGLQNLWKIKLSTGTGRGLCAKADLVGWFSLKRSRPIKSAKPNKNQGFNRDRSAFNRDRPPKPMKNQAFNRDRAPKPIKNQAFNRDRAPNPMENQAFNRDRAPKPVQI